MPWFGKVPPSLPPPHKPETSFFLRTPRIIFFDIDGTEPDLDDYFAVAKSTVPVSPDFDAMAFGDGNGLI